MVEKVYPYYSRFRALLKGVQRFQCKTCQKTFTETWGTFFYRKRTPEREILETLAFLAEGNRISTLARVKGHMEGTILPWIRDAAQHAEQLEDVLMVEFRVGRSHLDALWAYARNKGGKNYPEIDESGQFRRSMMLDTESRPRLARRIAKDETQASLAVFQTLQPDTAPQEPGLPIDHDPLRKWLHCTPAKAVRLTNHL